MISTIFYIMAYLGVGLGCAAFVYNPNAKDRNMEVAGCMLIAAFWPVFMIAKFVCAMLEITLS